jgi:DNA primase
MIMLTDGVRIEDVIRNEGIEVSRRGVFRCPFHDDRNPSAHVFPDNRFHCFGCGKRGDSIDFIMALKGLTFKEALAYLGIDGTPRETQIEINKRQKKQALVVAFRRWERQYYDKLATIYRATHKWMKGARSMEEVEKFAPLHHELPVIEHKMDILLYGSDEKKYRLFKEKNRGRV